MLKHGGEDAVYIGASVTSPFVQWVVGVLSSANGARCQFVKNSLLLFWQQPGLFGDSHGNLCPTVQLYRTQSWYWKLHLVIRNGQVGLCLPIMWWFHLDCLHIWTHFRMFLLYYISMMPVQCPLILAVSPCLPSSTPSSFLLRTWSSCSSPYIIYHKNLFYFLFLKKPIRTF